VGIPLEDRKKSQFVTTGASGKKRWRTSPSPPKSAELLEGLFKNQSSTRWHYAKAGRPSLARRASASDG
jgi:hypothetical protein